MRGRSIRRTFLSAAVLVFALVGNVLSPSSVTAAEGDNLKLSYGIYVAGTRVFKISYSASLTSEGYRTAVAMGPRGIGKAFADFKLKMAAAGLFSDGQPKPVDFSMQSSKEDEQKTVSMTWSSNDPPQADRSFKVPMDRAAEVNRVLDPQMPDPLTAVLRHALNGDAKPCTRPLRSYNGAEVYDLVFTPLGNDKIKTKGGAYSGPAYRCEVVFVPIAGFTAKKMKKHLSNPPTYTVWFAEITSPTTSTKYLVPIQAVGRAEGRTFQIVASEAQISGQSFTALSRLSD